jgi:hypothetical protein
MMHAIIESANKIIADKGIERTVRVLAIVGVYTTGKLVVKGGRKVLSIIRENKEEK